VSILRRNPTFSLLAVLSLVSLLTLAFAAGARANLEFADTQVRLQQGDGSFSRQAGEHADFSFYFSLPFDTAKGTTPEAAHSVVLDLPPGLVGNPTSIATCDMAEFALPGRSGAKCPPASQVGVARVMTASDNSEERHKVGIYNLPHGSGVPARFGFNVLNAVTLIEPQVRPGDYGISAGSPAIAQAVDVRSARITLWGVPSDPTHDFERQRESSVEIPGPFEGPSPEEIPAPEGMPRVGFMSNPTACTEAPVSFTVRGDSWEHRGIFDTRTLTADPDGTPFVFSGCDKLPFAPTAEVGPQSRQAESPSGLDVDINLPQSDDPGALATAAVRRVRMIFPQGVTVNASSAQGLGACSSAQIGLGTNDPPTCPEASKLGTVTIDTPLLSEQLQGSVYLATQGDNPFHSLLALYIAVEGPGFWLKLPGKVETNPVTGQLTTDFSDTPQLPFSRLQLQLTGGPRAALQTPRTCGSYSVRTEFTSWASEVPVVSDSPFTVDQGCAASSQFGPGLEAVTGNLQGGSFSPFTLRVTRQDGESNVSSLKATLPQGLLAKLAGVPLCPDAQAATGACPAASQVGTVTVGTGSGPNPLYVPEAGKAPTAAYLAGPYRGAPYSLVVKVPAEAGPFNLGTVTVRNALQIDPTTTQVTAESDPLPQILQGIPVSYRDLRVEVNRSEFTVNPTNCSTKQVVGTLTSATGQVAGAKAPLAVTGCGELEFGPSLELAMSGSTKRAGFPALSATLKAPAGQANIASTTVILPKTVFIAQEHVSGPCTRVQFAADACPASSVLGTATAWSPLLDQPLTGPVYFRSNGGERQLPDIVADLNGQIHVVLVGFIDSKKVSKETSLVRTRFASVPDAPVSKFVIKLKGGKLSLIQNSADLCKAKPKAEVSSAARTARPTTSGSRSQ
jgi:hypothetical protein